MTKRQILILDGHPDPDPQRYVHALAAAYRDGASSAGHETLLLRAADLDVPLLRTQAEYERGEPGEAVQRAQAAFDWATHVVILYPLWLGAMPALLKALLEQMLRPGFAFSTRQLGRPPVKFHAGKSARIVVTMGMPAFVYQHWYRAHSVRSLRRNVLQFIGFRRVRVSLIGAMGTLSRARYEAWLDKMRALGREGL
ncbi:MAG TPA: NAD(P)H-dependent oxidoreductase [Steroidobacter sp.]|jgi:putative NADPH-quinone reductase|nr:NAD(P)H-dependent oxidoreductase [Steroidobacteraceae bacterium]HLS82375.1 NAD(P)H-dependent oxidoreductase [Steroidobacter sp.]